MIQRFRVVLTTSAKVAEVKEGLKAIGFAANSIRSFENAQSGYVNIYAYRDDDAPEGDVMQTDPPPARRRTLRLDRMEDYCVQIWNRAGFCDCYLEEFNQAGQCLAFGQAEFDAWESG